MLVIILKGGRLAGRIEIDTDDPNSVALFDNMKEFSSPTTAFVTNAEELFNALPSNDLLKLREQVMVGEENLSGLAEEVFGMITELSTIELKTAIEKAPPAPPAKGSNKSRNGSLKQIVHDALLEGPKTMEELKALTGLDSKRVTDTICYLKNPDYCKPYTAMDIVKDTDGRYRIDV